MFWCCVVVEVLCGGRGVVWWWRCYVEDVVLCGEGACCGHVVHTLLVVNTGFGPGRLWCGVGGRSRCGVQCALCGVSTIHTV